MSWTRVGNIMGPPGAGTAIPDPLDVANEMDLGTDARLVKLTNGMKIDVRDSSGVWHTVVQWMAPGITPPAPLP